MQERKSEKREGCHSVASEEMNECIETDRRA